MKPFSDTLFSARVVSSFNTCRKALSAAGFLRAAAALWHSVLGLWVDLPCPERSVLDWPLGMHLRWSRGPFLSQPRPNHQHFVLPGASSKLADGNSSTLIAHLTAVFQIQRKTGACHCSERHFHSSADSKQGRNLESKSVRLQAISIHTAQCRGCRKL